MKAGNINWTIISFVIPFIYLVLFSSCNTTISETKAIKLAHGLDITHPVHAAMEYMGKRVHEKSNGKLRIDIYPNSQLGGERECVELLQIGSLGMTKVSTAVMESFSPSFKVFGLPYLFRDKDHFFNVLDTNIGQNILVSGEKFWLRGLCYYDAGSRSFYTKNKVIKTPSDLKGLKIRVQSSPTSIAMVDAFGGSATPISPGEIYTALQQGVVDGAENNPPTFHTSRHYEVCKYYTINEHSMVPDILLISEKIWDNLNKQEQQWIQEAADESVVVQRDLWQKAEEEALNAVKQAGVEIIYPDKEPFAKLVNHMYEGYKQDTAVYSVIKKIQNLNHTISSTSDSIKYEVQK